MSATRLTLTIVTAIILLHGRPAQAQASSTWVSGVGNDANPCTRQLPCKTFAVAIAKTTNGGAIRCLDRGSYGALTITKSVSILCGESTEASVLAPTTDGIVVIANATDRVILEGIDVDGLGSGGNGVSFLSGAQLVLNHCKVHGFTIGVNHVSSTANARVITHNSEIMFNTTGLSVASGINNSAAVNDTVIFGNQNFGVRVDGASSSIAFVRSEVVVSAIALSAVNSGSIFSIGPSNYFNGVSVGATPVYINFQ